jgi:hypothetical protein
MGCRSAEACFSWLQEKDTVDHVLMQCPCARQVWFSCLITAGLNIVYPQRDSTLEAWWDAACELVHKRDRRGFETLIILTALSLWKQRNARAFGNIAAM